VQTVERWYPPDIRKDLTLELANKILDRITEGLPGDPPGRRYTGAANASKRGAWTVIQEFCPRLNQAQAQTVIDTWITKGVLIHEDYYDPEQRKQRLGLGIGKHPGDTWSC